MNWQPIETAPNDMGEILLYCLPDKQYGIGEAYGSASMFETWDGSMFTPTHWMPLPEPPSA
jgi:hypothetical protein